VPMVWLEAVRRRGVGGSAQSDDQQAERQPQGQNGSHRIFSRVRYDVRTRDPKPQ